MLEQTGLGQGNILLVDDESGIRRILKIFLELEGYTIHEAVNANQAFEALEEHKIDLVILDIILFGITGFEVCERIKKDPKTKNICVIIFTALNQEHDFEEGKRVGADLYLTKPLNPKEIVNRVNQFLKGKSG
jgi:DNA-binding response OmpR family regulator